MPGAVLWAYTALGRSAGAPGGNPKAPMIIRQMSDLPQSQNDVGKLRIKQVFEYLKALNDHRNPAVRQVKEHPWHFWLDHLPDHPTIELQAVRSQKTRDTEECEDLTAPLYLFR